MQRRIIYFLTITVLFFGANFLVAHISSQTNPFSLRQMLNAVASVKEGRITQSKIISDIRKRKDEGATDEIIEGIRQNSLPLPTPIPTPILTPTPTPTPTPSPIPKPISTPVSTPTPTPKSTPTVSGKEMKNSIEMEFVKIPSGEFMMGSNNTEIDDALYECKKKYTECNREYFTSEMPKHKVTIKEGFWMGKFEVTQGQWQGIMGDNPSYFKDCGANCPVEYVSWDDIQIFLNRLNSRNTQFEYRLPTEAEWEYAARGGTTTAFAFGDSLNSSQANFNGEYPYASTKGKYIVKTVAVGSYQPNKFGLYDMHGNVWEWVQDIRSSSYQKLPVDGSPNLSDGLSSSRVSRGGSWHEIGVECRSAHRNGSGSPSHRNTNIGFRLVARAK